MKKFMSLFLVFCICLGFSTMSFAESKSNVVDGAAYQYAENLLSDLGIYEGVEAYTAADGFVKKRCICYLDHKIDEYRCCYRRKQLWFVGPQSR